MKCLHAGTVTESPLLPMELMPQGGPLLLSLSAVPGLGFSRSQTGTCVKQGLCPPFEQPEVPSMCALRCSGCGKESQSALLLLLGCSSAFCPALQGGTCLPELWVEQHWCQYSSPVLLPTWCLCVQLRRWLGCWAHGCLLLCPTVYWCHSSALLPHRGRAAWWWAFAHLSPILLKHGGGQPSLLPCRRLLGLDVTSGWFYEATRTAELFLCSSFSWGTNSNS